MDDDALLDALGVPVEPVKASSRTPQEERVIAGFEDILRFHQAHGRAPQHGTDRDIFERLYAVRLDQLRKLPDARILLSEMDTPGLLGDATTAPVMDELDADALLAELGVAAEPAGDDIRVLRHVRSHAEIKAAEEIADRAPCKDFETFKPLFDEVEAGLKQKLWVTRPFGKDAGIEVGDFFILGGLITYIAEVGDTYKTPNAETNGRLRVIYSNGTESDLLLRSLQRALYKDTEGRVGSRVIKVDTSSFSGPLFGDSAEPDDIESGTIYVLRSRSNHPFVEQHRELIHKIGVTGGKVEARIADAETEATYLLAGVDIIAEYKLHNIKRSRMEHIFHRLFAAAQLDLTIPDRFGNPVRPKEWFLVPLQVINEAVQRIVDGSITGYVYDPATASLVAA
nr:GIY-YIG nuclease family protein [Paraburkholderia sartisoli]